MTSRVITGRVYSSFADGIEGKKVTIEVSQAPGLPSFDIIGLCDSSIRESRGRIQNAIKQSGYQMPKGHITVSISPSFIRKTGSGFDLPIALGILLVSKQIPGLGCIDIYANGELSLNGEVHATPGSVVRLNSIKDDRYSAILIPKEEMDCAAIANVPCSFISSLYDACSRIYKNAFECFLPTDSGIDNYYDETEDHVLDFSVLKGQEKASRTILLSAAGWHNTLLIGSSGSGKTTAAQIIRGLLPKMNREEMASVFSLYDTLGISDRLTHKALARPFRTIAPGITANSLIGSSCSLKPGEISQANHGVLFMDELCEYSTRLIDLLRIPMEEREVTLHRDGRSITYPSNFLFVGATNPCRCGMFLEKPSKCTCPLSIRTNYLSKLSGPFIDRIDLVTEMYSVDKRSLVESVNSNNSDISNSLRTRVAECWQRQRERYSHTSSPYSLNGSFDSDNLAEVLRADSEVVDMAASAASVGEFSVRSFKRLLRVGRTIADLDEREDMNVNDITEALSYRFRRSI